MAIIITFPQMLYLGTLCLMYLSDTSKKDFISYQQLYGLSRPIVRFIF